MNLIGSFVIAFSMYSRIPMPRMDWTEERMRYALCFFPLIGAVIGAVEIATFALCEILAAFLGDLFTYCVTSIQLAFAYPSEAGGVGASAVKFLGVFAPTQIPLAVIEGILTVVIVIGLETYAKPELRSIGFFKNKKGETQDE